MSEAVNGGDVRTYAAGVPQVSVWRDYPLELTCACVCGRGGFRSHISALHCRYVTVEGIGKETILKGGLGGGGITIQHVCTIKCVDMADFTSRSLPYTIGM